MSILCCCRNRQPAEKETQAEAIELPILPPRARLSKTPTRSDTDMYLSSLLASRGPSQLVIPAYHNIVDPEAVEVEDSDEDEPERATRGSNPGTLGSLRTRLVRRLSHRVNGKTSSRPSAGASDEELARRAELKRLMHKRIQEELKSEEEEEDDDHRLVPLKRPSTNNCKEPELPGGGPRDTIEFSVSGVDEQETRKGVGSLPEISLPRTTINTEHQAPYQQRNMCSGSVTGSIGNTYHKCNLTPDRMGSVTQPPSPSPPYPTSVHLLGGSGRESPSTASWRLSRSEIHIESYIEPLVEAKPVSRAQSLEPERPLSKQEHDTTHPHEATPDTTDHSGRTLPDKEVGTSYTIQFEQSAILEESYKENEISNCFFETSEGRCSPLDVWLRSQNVHCASILSSRPNSEMAFEHERDFREQASVPHKSETLTDLSETSILSTISQQHSRGGQQKSPIDLLVEGKPSVTAPSSESVALYRVLNRMENAFPLEEPPTNNQNQDVSSHYTSSRYTTTPNSQQATPRGSQLSLTEQPVDHGVLQPVSSIYGCASPYHKMTSDNSDLSSYRTALNKTSSSDYAKSRPEASQVLMAEVSSMNASETASFRQREEELKSIKKRFGLITARQYPVTPVRSKFREEFEDPKGSSSGKSSILSKFYLAFPMRAKASRSGTELNSQGGKFEIHLTDFRKYEKTKHAGLNMSRQQHLPSNMASKVRLGHTTITGPWQCAPKRAANLHPEKKINKAAIPTTERKDAQMQPVSGSNYSLDISKTQDSHEAREPSAENLLPPSGNCPDGGISTENDVSNTVGIHAGVLQEWVEQLQAEDMQRQSRVESRINLHKRQPPRLRTPPASWAKWPSHTREERTASAGKRDRVNSRDFAVVINPTPLGNETGGKASSTDRELPTTPPTLSSQVSKVFKSSWHRIITHTGSLGRASHHGSVAQSTLEYPELELLPTAEGYREVQALDQQIGTMKRRSTSTMRVMQQSSSDGARHLLASRIAEEVHRFQIEGQDIVWADTKHRVKDPPTTRHLSPARSLFARRSKSCDPELFVAQGSRSTCVQPKMLHDDNNDNIAKVPDRVVIKRAKSTGNIEMKPGNDPLLEVEENHGPVPKAQKSGLRRHQSLGWIRGRGPRG
ncbi:hypothetical protein F5Y14DRAFT_60949 [Nemania sp. NC0429]|nr:hypothetical protein F5Y14DRAFT_60949 [Nemania sp. NC0429]